MELKKICISCKIEKSLTEYSARRNICKKCLVEYQKARRHEKAGKQPIEINYTQKIQKMLMKGNRKKLIVKM